MVQFMHLNQMRELRPTSEHSKCNHNLTLIGKVYSLEVTCKILMQGLYKETLGKGVLLPLLHYKITTLQLDNWPKSPGRIDQVYY